MDNYTVYHLHTDLSNLTAGNKADSITKYNHYIEKASELGMTSIAFSEHGSVMNWVKKKEEVEKHGMKYIHANEIYLTESIEYDAENDKIIKKRDNYHYMLLAKNHDGVRELNKLTSKTFDQNDGHFYYNPRVTFDELKSTSDNIIMTSACLASPLWRLYNNDKNKFEDMVAWMETQRHRMFFEIQYHNHPEQVEFNRLLLNLSKSTKIPLIAGTDTHALNAEHAEGRKVLLQAKGATYGDEDLFDLTFKSYDELVDMFEKQNAIPRNEYLEAIHNTNVMSDMVEEFTLDRSPKYPKLYDNPIELFKKKINEGYVKRGIIDKDLEEKKVYLERIKEEFDTYDKLDAVDYMLLQTNIIEWCHSKGIYQGYGRGSVNGSLIAYLLGVTEMDSIKHKLNFFRFLNPDRVSLADIDIDFPKHRRQEVIDYVASIEGLEFSEIITYNTLQTKASIKEIGRAFKLPLDEVDAISKAIDDNREGKMREKYPEVFKFVDLFEDVVISMGSHPSGYVVSPKELKLEEEMSTVYTKESKYKVTAINMKEIDGLNFVKLDMLGLRNMDIINNACEIAGIERLTPDNIDANDEKVWKSMTESTLGVFQMESDSAFNYIKELFSDETIEKVKEEIGQIDYISLMSMANGAIRPAGESYRGLLSKGITSDNGHDAINELFKSNLGYCIEESQYVSTSNGYKKIKDITVMDEVYTKKGLRRVVKKKYMGNKNTLKMILSNGRSVIATPDHKVYTSGGWKELKDVKSTDTVAYLTGNDSTKSYDKNKLTLIAYLIGDGGLTTGNYINFVNADINVVNNYVKCIGETYENIDVSVTDVKSRVNNLPLYKCRIRGINKRLESKDNGLLEYLMKLGLKFEGGGGSHSNDKFIPQFIFGLNSESMFHFLGAFFDTDGSISKNGDIRFKTSSQALAYDIQELGRLLGYSFTVTENSSKSYDITVNESKSLYYNIKDSSELLKGKHSKMSDVVDKKTEKSSSNCIDIKFFKIIIEDIMNKKGETYFSLFKRYGFAKGASSSVKNGARNFISLGTLKVFSEEIDENYKYLLDDNIKWLKVKSVSEYLDSDVYDIEVDGEHNFTANGIVVHNCIFQEDIMLFLTEFCGFSGSEADTVRRGFAKKTGTEQFLPAIRSGFIKTMTSKYGETEEYADEILEKLLKVIEDASDYGFSSNHSSPYSYIGYVCAYLRYYYPYEFATTLLNVFEDKADKSEKIMTYIKEKDYAVKNISFGKSGSKYTYSKEEGVIYKGLKSIKFMNDSTAEELLELSKNQYVDFIELLKDITEKTSINSKQTTILIRLGFFNSFGGSKYLHKSQELFLDRFKKTHKDATKIKRMEEIRESVSNFDDCEEYEINEKIHYEKQMLGYAVSKEEATDKAYAVVLDINTKYSPLVSLYSVKSGIEFPVKISKAKFTRDGRQLLQVGDLIKVRGMERKNKQKLVDGKWVKLDDTQLWLNSWELIDRIEE